MQVAGIIGDWRTRGGRDEEERRDTADVSGTLITPWGRTIKLETRIKLLENEKARMERDAAEKVAKQKEAASPKAGHAKLRTLLADLFTTTDFDVSLLPFLSGCV